MPNPSPAILLDGLTKRYGKVMGVDDLHLDVEPGETFGFLGPNGAGKTTTIRLLTGFLRPSSGRAFVFGRDIVKESTAIRRLIGFVPGTIPYEQMTGHQVLHYLGALQGKPSVMRQELCERLKLGENDLHRKLHDYSKGMRQKVAIIQALQHDPELIIMDEPTEGLDPLMQNELFSILKERSALGRTIFLSSHIISEVERLCDRVAIIRDGRLVAVEDVDAMRRRRSLRIEIEVASGQLPEAVLKMAGATLVSSSDSRAVISYQGDLAPLLTALSNMKLEDLTMERPSLEEVFLAFYDTDGAGPLPSIKEQVVKS
ncbi:MAG: ABC transporter ATP-binding protein [Dehalococcoidia bacterium]|nr:ABC transporter ATP-binding protein [Dehalococcoidia bacterium]